MSHNSRAVEEARQHRLRLSHESLRHDDEAEKSSCKVVEEVEEAKLVPSNSGGPRRCI